MPEAENHTLEVQTLLTHGEFSKDTQEKYILTEWICQAEQIQQLEISTS